MFSRFYIPIVDYKILDEQKENIQTKNHLRIWLTVEYEIGY